MPVKASPLYSSSICWPNLDHIFIICMPRSREKVKKLFFPQIGRRHFISSIIRILGYSSETEKRVRCSTAEPERCPEHLQKSLQNENYYPHFIVMGTKAQKKKKTTSLIDSSNICWCLLCATIPSAEVSIISKTGEISAFMQRTYLCGGGERAENNRYIKQVVDQMEINTWKKN